MNNRKCTQATAIEISGQTFFEFLKKKFLCSITGFISVLVNPIMTPFTAKNFALCAKHHRKNIVSQITQKLLNILCFWAHFLASFSETDSTRITTKMPLSKL